MHLRPATITATCLALALPLQGRADAQLRLTPEVAAGGGWASTLFVGSDFPAHWQGIFTPGLDAALSTGPVVKLFADYHYTWAQYGADASGQVHDASTTARFRLGRVVDLDLGTSLLALSFSDPVPQDPTRPAATSSLGGDLSPLLRLRLADSVTLEGGYTFSRRASQTADLAEIRETGHEGFAAATLRLGPAVEAGLRARHITSAASTAVYSYDGDGGAIFGAWSPFGELVLHGSLGLQWNRFDGGRSDRYAVAAVDASWPLTDDVSAELAWSVADNASNQSFDGTRYLTYAGLRAELPWWL